MKKTTAFTLILLLFGTASYAQGGFGGLRYKADISPFGGMMMIGGGGAWVINESFYLGGAGFGSVNSLLVEDATLSSFGYGGLNLGYFQQIKDSPVRIGADILLGSGGYTYDNNAYSLFLMEPSVNFWYRINSFMQFSAGIYYRIGFFDADSLLDPSALNNPGVSVSLYFGTF